MPKDQKSPLLVSKRPVIRSDYDDFSIIPPPPTVICDAPKAVLWTPDGDALIRKIGY